MRIVGTVVEETSGKPLAGLQVRAFDKDLIFDDKLGTAVTDEAGKFRMDYSSLDFSLLGGLETYPSFTFESSTRKARSCCTRPRQQFAKAASLRSDLISGYPRRSSVASISRLGPSPSICR